MKELRIKNFRTIEDSGDIELKPLTIFLGKNSCGKSSFLRILPLLKQSLEKDTSEPLLWFGDYVDFGNYENILPKNTSKKFELSFTIEVEEANVNADLYVNITFSRKHIDFFEIKYLGQHIKCKRTENDKVAIDINGDSKISNGNFFWGQTSKELLPNIYCESSLPISFLNLRYLRGNILLSEKDNNLKRLDDLIKSLTDDNVKVDVEIMYDLIYQFGSKESLISRLRHNSIFEKKCKMLQDDDELFTNINNYIVLLNLGDLIQNINNIVTNEVNNICYIKPIRANASRYYRIQGININRVDSDGTNLPMVLYNLGDDDRANFENWCKKKFNLKFSVHDENGQVSLIVKEKDEQEINLADAGYGYSQVLPIILQLWLLKFKKVARRTSRRYRGMNYCNEFKVVIEQPELHLHPAFQAKLVDVFVAILKESKDLNIKIIFETHSETMINRLGALVSKNEISPKNINVVMVEIEKGCSYFKQKSYDEEGLIKEWPIGFMSAGEN